MTTKAYIGLGSNLQNPKRQIEKALTELGQIPRSSLVHTSKLYGSTPVGPADQPDYINAVAAISTELSPLQLLDELQAIENDHQRIRSTHWGARTLDLDLLLYGNQTIDNDRLIVPHQFLSQRNFVLYPLADIDPSMTLPSGVTLESLLTQCPKEGLWPLE